MEVNAKMLLVLVASLMLRAMQEPGCELKQGGQQLVSAHSPAAPS